MNLSIGIIGLPNVGKSTIFNALTANSVPAENYPFCTIEPNVGIIPVNDPRLEKLAAIEKSCKVVPAVVKFVDIAGLVKGASRGEGLGNKFLAHIREVDAIIHVIRKFEDKNVVHVDEKVDPLRDISTVETELVLKDSETVQKKLEFVEKQARGDEKLVPFVEFSKELLEHLNKGGLAFDFLWAKEDEVRNFRKELFLLTDKPIIYLINESQENISQELLSSLRKQLNLKDSCKIIALDAKLETEISQLDKKEQKQFLEGLGLAKRSLDLLIETGYQALGLISFFTAGEDEARAWTIYEGESIVQAAGVIHTDFAEKFIAADVISYDDFIKYNGWEGCRQAGKVRLEGKQYIVKNGDVMIIRHGA